MTENIDPIQKEEIQMEPTVATATESVAVETPEATDEAAPELFEKKFYANRQEIIDRLSVIANEATEQAKAEINYLKMLYYKIRQQEVDAELQKFINDNGDPAAYESKTDDLEPKLKELLAVQKEARAVMVEARNKEMAENLAKKNEILDKMDAIASDADGIGQQYNVFQDLQKQFKEVGAVDPQEVNVLWKRFSAIGEKFYDALKINKELRDYDFKKNLEKKEALCEEAEKLSEAGDVLSAFRRLQEMHEEWKGIGPVAKEIREEIWSRFKAASTIINKRHQEHFESLKAAEAANEQGKIALCEKLEAIQVAAISTVKDWEEQTQAVLKIQEEWRKLGFANKKVNNSLFERFRGLCDAFFQAKAEYYKAIKEEQNENLAKKIALCEKAEALKDSTDWRSTTDLLVKLQQDWKEIGPVNRKNSNAIWERFRSACNAFFDAKEKAVGDERSVEKANLEKKLEILEKLSQLKDNVADATPDQVRALMNEWKEVGHVPFKEKDKLFKAYQEKVDFFFENLDMKSRPQSRGNRQKGEKSRNVPENDRARLMRQYDTLTRELKTYENNLGFLSFGNKGGKNPLLAQMEQKMEGIKKQISEIVEKINNLDE
ncbi:MAG: DUF349 domain-containing protein [Bacteroidales bacterium]|nr:DUF349 domain-containing protein [Bacteroidales bacterium]